MFHKHILVNKKYCIFFQRINRLCNKQTARSGAVPVERLCIRCRILLGRPITVHVFPPEFPLWDDTRDADQIGMHHRCLQEGA